MPASEPDIRSCISRLLQGGTTLQEENRTASPALKAWLEEHQSVFAHTQPQTGLPLPDGCSAIIGRHPVFPNHEADAPFMLTPAPSLQTLPFGKIQTPDGQEIDITPVLHIILPPHDIAQRHADTMNGKYWLILNSAALGKLGHFDGRQYHLQGSSCLSVGIGVINDIHIPSGQVIHQTVFTVPIQAWSRQIVPILTLHLTSTEP